jgi:hypothetical protein
LARIALAILASVLIVWKKKWISYQFISPWDWSFLA